MIKEQIIIKINALILINFEERPKQINKIMKNGEILWSGENGLQIIGTQEETWEEYFIVEFPNSNVFQESINQLTSLNFSNIRIFKIKPINKLKLNILQFLMKFIFSKLPMKLGRMDVNVEENLDKIESEIIPTRNQMTKLLAADKSMYVDMLNFIKYYDKAKYPQDFLQKKDISGAEAYNKYGSKVMRVVAKLGGYIIHVGKVEGIVAGEASTNWDEYAIMRYPNKKTFRSMFTVKANKEGGIHRDAGLEKTNVFAFDPQN